jgi:hypothetical protein
MRPDGVRDPDQSAVYEAWTQACSHHGPLQNLTDWSWPQDQVLERNTGAAEPYYRFTIGHVSNSRSLPEPVMRTGISSMSERLRCPVVLPRQSVWTRIDSQGGHRQFDMFWVALMIAASAGIGGYASYAARQAEIPQLQHRPGTPIEIVRTCREVAVAAARGHAAEMGVELIRVDATSAGPMRRVGRSQVAPVEIGVVYTRPSGEREARKGTIQCRVDPRGRAVITDLQVAAR